VSAVMKARILDSTLNAKGPGVAGNANPDSAQAANTASIRAKAKTVALVSRTIGVNVRSDSVANSTRNKGAKNRTRYMAGSGGIGG
jgi:hypothetical protein